MDAELLSSVPDWRPGSVLSLLLHLSRLVQIGELFRFSALLDTVTGDNIALGSRAVLPELERRVQAVRPPAEVSHRDAEIISLVVGCIEDVETDVRVQGRASPLEAFRNLLYCNMPSSLTLMQLAAYTDPVKAEAVRRVCTYLLEEALSPSNCLQMLQFSEQHGFPVLAMSTRALATHSFSEVIVSDTKGLSALTQDTLTSLLSAGSLTVQSEAVKFVAIAVWVRAKPAARRAAFAQLFDMINLHKLSRRELVEMDMHPLVVENLHATGRVAHAFISLMFGPRSQPFQESDLTPTTLPPPSAARQCFQSATSSLYQHLCDTVSPALPPTPSSESSQATDMQIDHAVQAGEDDEDRESVGETRMHELPHCLRSSAPLPAEMDISPGKAHRAAAARPPAQTCKRQLFFKA